MPALTRKEKVLISNLTNKFKKTNKPATYEDLRNILESVLGKKLTRDSHLTREQELIMNAIKSNLGVEDLREAA